MCDYCEYDDCCDSNDFETDDYDDDDRDYDNDEYDDCDCDACSQEYGCDIDFQDPGGNSALRRATRNNPRNLPCPDCGRPNMLTPKDKQLGYRCDICAEECERGGY